MGIREQASERSRQAKQMLSRLRALLSGAPEENIAAPKASPDPSADAKRRTEEARARHPRQAAVADAMYKAFRSATGPWFNSTGSVEPKPSMVQSSRPPRSTNSPLEEAFSLILTL